MGSKAPCAMALQGFTPGSCAVRLPGGSTGLACQSTLRKEGDLWYRLVHSVHLSRPEDYLSVYQSGCNHDCLKCHSWRFTQNFDGYWVSAEGLAEMAADYESSVTVWEPKERATMWHATDLCRHCGSCFLAGVRGRLCPRKLSLDQIIYSPQGFGPARNIVSFTGGDLACRPEFYAQAAEKIKDACSNRMWILLETNGYGLTPKNLEALAEGGVDAFWLDIKAYDGEVYRRLCGAPNDWILEAPERIVDKGFVLEVSTLFIPGWVETDQIARIAGLLAGVDREIPFTILAFFPEYKLMGARPPTMAEMIGAFSAARSEGLKNVKLGNCHVFAKTGEEWEKLISAVGGSSIG